MSILPINKLDSRPWHRSDALPWRDPFHSISVVCRTSADAQQQYPTRLSLAAASVVTIGFFSGVIFDPNHATSAATSSSKSQLGIIFGLASSVMSAFHAVLIKRGLVRISFISTNSPFFQDGSDGRRQADVDVDIDCLDCRATAGKRQLAGVKAQMGKH